MLNTYQVEVTGTSLISAEDAELAEALMRSDISDYLDDLEVKVTEVKKD